MTAPLRVLLVGYGPVGARLVEELLPAVRPGLIELTVVGAEAADAYNRVLIAEYAVGRTGREAMVITDSPTAVADGVRLLTGVWVTGIDREAHTVVLSTGEVEPYDRLVLATGARSNVPTLDGVERPGRDLRSVVQGGHTLIAHDPVLPDGVTVLRDLADAERVQLAVRSRRRIVILGAGVLGLELALAAAQEGAEVCVVHHGGYPMARNLDRGGGTVLAQSLRRAGISIVAHSRAEGVSYHTDGDGVRRFDALVCADGKEIHGDLLVLSCGVGARTELATLADLPTSSGILVDSTLRSWGDDSIYAIGDCAHVAPRPDGTTVAARTTVIAGIPGGPPGLIGPGWRQAEWLAAAFRADVNLVPREAELPGERPALVMLKADGIDVVSVGVTEPEPWDSDPLASDDPAHPVAHRQVSQWSDPEHGRYVKMVTRAGVLEGMVCVGLPRTGAELTLLFERGSELPADRSVLLRHDGPDYTPAADTGAFAPDSTVCWCNGVTVGHIHDSVELGNTTVSCISAATRAGTGCGGCKGRIAELLERFTATDEPTEVSGRAGPAAVAARG